MNYYAEHVSSKNAPGKITPGRLTPRNLLPEKMPFMLWDTLTVKMLSHLNFVSLDFRGL